MSFPNEFWKGEKAQTGTYYATRGKDTQTQIDMTFYNTGKDLLERGPIYVSKGFQSIRAALKKMGPRGVYCKNLIGSSKIHKRMDPGKSRAVAGESLHKRLEEGWRT